MARRPKYPPIEPTTEAIDPVDPEVTPPETPSAIEEAQDGAEVQAPEDMDERIARIVAKTLAGTMPKMAESMAQAMVAAQMTVKKQDELDDHDRRLKEMRRKAALEERCHICRQVVGDGRGRGCGGPFRRDPKTNAFVMEPVMNLKTGEPVLDGEGKPMFRRIEDAHQFHVLRVVYPRDPIALKAWDGIIINAAIYYSNGPEHKIWTPRNTDIDALLTLFEATERDQAVGRTRVRAYGGTISGRGNTVQSAPLGVGFQ